MKCLAVANQKGGVGKTTTAIHLAHGFALSGAAVAILDLDPQGNAGVAVQGMGDGQTGKLGRHLGDSLWLLPGSVASPGDEAPITKVKSIAGIGSELDWLIIDCPPRIDRPLWEQLRSVDRLVVPVQAEFLAMHGLSQMLGSFAMDPEEHQVRSVLATMVDASQPISVEILEDLRENLGGALLDSMVLRDLSLVEAASHGRTVFTHCPWAPSAVCYAELTKELLHG